MFDNRLYRVYKHSTGCQTGLTTRGCLFNTVVNLVVKPGCTTGLTTVLNEQSVRSTRLSNRVCQTGCTPVEQTAVVQHGCQTGYHNQLSNRFDNRLDVCLHETASCQTGSVHALYFLQQSIVQSLRVRLLITAKIVLIS